MHQVETSQPSSIFIVDDHPLIRRVIKHLLSLESHLAVVGEAVSAEETLAGLGEPIPDLFLIDFSLPGMNGADLIKEIHVVHPNTKCLVVSSHHEQPYVNAALAAGAHGFVTKGDPDMLLNAISRVLQGETVVNLES